MGDLTVHKPDWNEVVKRRFGSRHEKPCANPNVLTCAMPDCQIANRCRHSPAKTPHLRPKEEDRG